MFVYKCLHIKLQIRKYKKEKSQLKKFKLLALSIFVQEFFFNWKVNKTEVIILKKQIDKKSI